MLPQRSSLNFRMLEDEDPALGNSVFGRHHNQQAAHRDSQEWGSGATAMTNCQRNAWIMFGFRFLGSKVSKGDSVRIAR